MNDAENPFKAQLAAASLGDLEEVHGAGNPDGLYTALQLGGAPEWMLRAVRDLPESRTWRGDQRDLRRYLLVEAVRRRFKDYSFQQCVDEVAAWLGRQRLEYVIGSTVRASHYRVAENAAQNPHRYFVGTLALEAYWAHLGLPTSVAMLGHDALIDLLSEKIAAKN